jgi:hypothetical protein
VVIAATIEDVKQFDEPLSGEFVPV